MNSFQWFFRLANKMISFKGFLASDFKGAFPFTRTVSKIMDFKENDLFQENEQNEHISVKLQILSNFQKIAFHRLVYLSQKLWILSKLTHLSDLTEITDSNGFSKESFLPFVVLV